MEMFFPPISPTSPWRDTPKNAAFLRESGVFAPGRKYFLTNRIICVIVPELGTRGLGQGRSPLTQTLGLVKTERKGKIP